MTGRYPAGPGKLLLLALDAASPALLRRWAADGTMPNVARLLREGLSGDTRAVEGLYVGAAWPSFYTGRNPAGHGIYWLERLVPGSYRIQQVRPVDFSRHKPLWELLSEAGRRVAVMDVPLSRVSAELLGFQVSSWGDHDRAFPFHTFPRPLADAVLRAAGPHPAPAACDAPAGRTLAEYRAFAGLLREGAAARARLTRHLLGGGEWDFAIQVFSETHCAGHQLWHFHDPAHPAFDASVTATAGDLVRETYAAVDAAVGEVLAGVGPDTTVVLFSLHGMSYNCGASALLADILVRLGVMKRASSPAPDGSGAAAPPAPRKARGWKALLTSVYRRIPEGIRLPLWEWRQRFNQKSGLGTLMDLDPAGSRCFMVWTGPLFAGIRLNLRGREPEGTLEPGDETERFIAGLRDDLLALVRPDSGQPLVRRVHRTRDLFRGECEEVLPDLLVEWHTEPPLGTTVAGGGKGAAIVATSPKTGRLELLNSNCRTGEHRSEGMFVARGPGITPGRLDRIISVLDLAPSFAGRFGVAMPGADGTPVPELMGDAARPSP